MLTFNTTNLLYAIAGIILIVFIIVEWRIHQTKKQMQDLIMMAIIGNNAAVEKLLDKKDEVMKVILHRITDEIFDHYEELNGKIAAIENKQNSSESV